MRPPERDIGVMRAPLRSSLTLIGIFLVVLLAVGLLDRIGAAPSFAPFSLVSAALVLFLLSALYAHSRRATDFYVADRRAVARFNGVAGASALAGLLAVGLAGGAYDARSSFLLSAIGFAGGYLVLGFAIAPGLRSFNAYTAGDFIGARFGGFLARLVWAGITFVISFMLFVTAMEIAAPLVATLFRLTPEFALYVVAALAAMAALPGGMRSLTWTQVVQYLVIAIACLVPAVFIAAGGPTAQSALTEQFITLRDNLPVIGNAGVSGWMPPLFLAVFGAASLPHLSARSLAAPSRREAVLSMVWAVLFSIMLVLVGFVLFELLVDAIATEGPQDLGGESLQFATLFAVLPAMLSGLLLAGTLAALLSLGQAALFSATTAISHDIWDEIIDRRGPEGRRIMTARVILVGVAAGGVMFASVLPADAASMASWALALAAAGCFVPLVLGLWWPRCNEIGAVAGMAVGFAFTALVYLLRQHVIPDAIVTSGWAEVGAPTAAAAGMVMALAVTVGLSLATPAPDKAAQELASGRKPRRRRVPTRERPA